MKPVEIVNSINSLKTKSQNLLIKAQTINMTNGQNCGGPYPSIIAGLEEIMTTSANITSDLPGSLSLEEKDAAAVSDAFKEFVHAHQVLLHLLTSKAGLFKTGQPVAVALRQEKDIIDSLALGLMETSKSRQSEIKTQQQSLIQTIRACYRAHERT